MSFTMSSPGAGPSRPPKKPHPDTSSDEIVVIDSLPAGLSATNTPTRSRSKSQTPKAGGAARVAKVGKTVSRPTRAPRRQKSDTVEHSTKTGLGSLSARKGKAKSEEVLVEDTDEEEDSPVFVRESLATRLAEKYTFKSSSSSKSTTPSVKNGSPSTKPEVPPLVLVPPLSLTAPPVPPWLGKTSILLQLPTCVVCKVRWKKSDSGAARWVGCRSLLSAIS